jgi:exosortase/archaeosortase family protein
VFIPAFGDGTVLVLRKSTFGVETACCGLRAMMICVGVCTGAAFVMQRNLLDKVVVVASAAPFAVLVNMVRITGVGIAGELLGDDFANWFHHHSSALVVPIVIVLLWGEMGLMSRLRAIYERRRQLAPGITS